MVGKRFQPDQERDAIAELARLVAHAEIHTEGAPSKTGPKHPDRNDARRVNDELHAAAEEYQNNEVPHYSGSEVQDQDGVVPRYLTKKENQDYEIWRARRRSLSVVMATLGVALLGSACAVGYRNVFRGLASPAVAPMSQVMNERWIGLASNEPQAKASGDTQQSSAATTGSIDSLVPAPSAPATARAVAGARTLTPSAAMPTIAQGLGQSANANATAQPNHERLAAVPVTHANSDTSAAASRAVAASGYMVQVTSERSEGRAQVAFRALQTKYPKQLSGRQPMIRRADLGAAGIHYRALIGPFASAEQATKLCRGLKAEGGDCLVQKNQ